MATKVDSLPSVGTRSVDIEQQLEELQRLAGQAEIPAVEMDEVSKPTAELPTWGELGKLLRSKLQASLRTENPLATATKYLGVAMAIGLIGLIPWPHSVKCKVVCEPVVHRYVAAPFDCKLLKSNVLVGQEVRKGDVLAILDGGELLSQLAGARAKLAQSEQRQLAALSTGDHSKSELERLEIEHLTREIELLESRQANLEVKSPMDGIVISGDLERAEGAPLSVGDNLFEIASLDRLVAQIAIPESEISHVAEEMPVFVTLDSVPENRFESTVQRIHFRNELRDNQSVFIAETELPNDGQILRPGMNGVAKIQVGNRSVGWILFHRPYNAMRHWIGW